MEDPDSKNAGWRGECLVKNGWHAVWRVIGPLDRSVALGAIPAAIGNCGMEIARQAPTASAARPGALFLAYKPPLLGALNRAWGLAPPFSSTRDTRTARSSNYDSSLVAAALRGNSASQDRNIGHLQPGSHFASAASRQPRAHNQFRSSLASRLLIRSTMM